MVEEDKTVTWSPFKKKIVYSIVGTVLTLALIGAFVPEAREYVTGMVKILLGGISTTM